MPASSKKRVVVALSGGVDSSAAAAMLLQQGFEVIGLHILLFRDSRFPDATRSPGEPRNLADARAVCEQLGIKLVVVDRSDEFDRLIIQSFAAEYRAGRTPNPCVLCNARIKFDALLATARELEADHVATGHYARVEWDETCQRYLLKRAADLQQDQSYFLFALRQEQLAPALFPLGLLEKAKAREIAAAHCLPTSTKPESQEICFVPDRNYGEFMLRTGLTQKHRGEIVARDGRLLGYHDGIEFYTIGQRRGLRIAAKRPLYVIELDPSNNRVIAGYAEELARASFTVRNCNWIAFSEPRPSFQATVKIRYQHHGAPATVRRLSESEVLVTLAEPQRAVTPGQACVFYNENTVLGGGWIA
ncbi:MAG: tRNA 2-thiouridine(34) synthase MnmA [Verrucomicrobiae bacterium]|nr:tRNA 2-thiouridine(34) synthase MnmA [Verrucomicrobiae bacterium]